MDDWDLNAGTICLLVVLILVVAALAVLAGRGLMDKHPVSGAVVKAWTADSSHYVVLESADGKRKTYQVSANDYGLMNIGDACTVLLDDFGSLSSPSCTKPEDKP